DVQPEDPVELWASPPFEPTVRGDRLYARGASDDKGQVYIHVQTIAAHFATHGALPVNLKVIIGGDEEIGSRNLMPYVLANQERLACDTLLISDTSMFAPDTPTLDYGLRGLVYCNVTVRTGTSDMHSGQYGGAGPNAIHVLAELIAKLKDADGRITIPGFYDKVIPLTDDERARYAALPFDEAAFAQHIGAATLPGEAGYSVLERIWARPSLDVNGVWGGWTGAGSKTVIPCEAHAKISMRLVPDQDPTEIGRLLAEHLQNLAPVGTTVETRWNHGALPFLTPTDSPVFAAAERALTRAFHKPVVRARSGGSIPFIPAVTRALGVPAILMGFTLPDSNLHAPNEQLFIPNFSHGIRAVTYFYEELANLPG
ncbi:MAG: dipeptidase, partial [Dehalococcoidia bacterium]|nr:dipeptidase [Dehalococcoidia bacterium]